MQARAKRRLEAIEREMEEAATRRLGSSSPADRAADDDKIKRTKIDREDAVEGDEDDLDREFEVSLDYGEDEEDEAGGSGDEGKDKKPGKRGRGSGSRKKAGRRRYRRKGETLTTANGKLYSYF